MRRCPKAAQAPAVHMIARRRRMCSTSRTAGRARPRSARMSAVARRAAIQRARGLAEVHLHSLELSSFRAPRRLDLICRRHRAVGLEAYFRHKGPTTRCDRCSVGTSHAVASSRGSRRLTSRRHVLRAGTVGALLVADRSVARRACATPQEVALRNLIRRAMHQRQSPWEVVWNSSTL